MVSGRTDAGDCDVRHIERGLQRNPNRNDNDEPTVLAGANEYTLWRVLAPRAVDEAASQVALTSADATRWTSAFDQVWQTLKAMYYSQGPSAAEWDSLRLKYRARMAAVKDLAGAERVIDDMIAEQPAIKPPAGPARGVVASGNALASQAGADVLAHGGNVIDAAIATAFALGVVEPDASGLGGDGQAILFLKGMAEPVVVEYKDMTPGHATPDNPKIFTATGGRTAPDGPTVANIPGIPAGLDLLYKKYGSKKIAWADLIAPAVKLADEGLHPRRSAADDDRRGPRRLRQISRGREDLSAGRQGPEGRRSLFQQGLCGNAARAGQGGRRLVLSRHHRQEDCR
jgi:hypothetical protein